MKIQRLLGERSLAVNAHKTRRDDEVLRLASGTIDEIKIQLLELRRDIVVDEYGTTSIEEVALPPSRLSRLRFPDGRSEGRAQSRDGCDDTIQGNRPLHSLRARSIRPEVVTDGLPSGVNDGELEEPLERIEISVAMNQRVLLSNAEGRNQAIDRLAHCVAASSKCPVVARGLTGQISAARVEELQLEQRTLDSPLNLMADRTAAARERSSSIVTPAGPWS